MMSTCSLAIDRAKLWGGSCRLMAITVDSQAERDYLARLAAALKLPAEAVAHIQAKLAG